MKDVPILGEEILISVGQKLAELYASSYSLFEVVKWETRISYLLLPGLY